MDGEIPILTKKTPESKELVAIEKGIRNFGEVTNVQLKEIRDLKRKLYPNPATTKPSSAKETSKPSEKKEESKTSGKSPSKKPGKNGKNVWEKRLEEEDDDAYEKRIEKEKKKRDRFEKISTSIDSGAEIFSQNLFAPAGVLNSSIAELTGIDIQKGITDKLKGLFDPDAKAEKNKKKLDARRGEGLFGTGKDFKKPLTKAQLRKVDPGSVYLGDLLTKGKGEEEDSGIDKITSGLLAGFGPVASGALSTFAKVGGIAALAGGIIWGVTDALTAAAKAEEWGTSKLSAGIAGFLAGGESGGIDNAFKNAAKWALIGGGVGTLLAPGIGTIAGILIGVAFGGILGFFGSETIAKNLDNIGKWVKDFWDSDVVKGIRETVAKVAVALWEMIKSPFIGMIDAIKTFDFSVFGEIWSDPDKTIAQKLGATVGAVFDLAITAISGWFGGMIKGVVNFFGDIFGKDDGSDVKSKSGIDIIKTVAIGIADFFTSMFSSIWNAIQKNPIYQAVAGFFDTYIVKPVSAFFNQIGDYFAFLGSMNIMDLAGSFLNGTFFQKRNEYYGARNVQRAIASGEVEKFAVEKGGFYTGYGDNIHVDSAAKAYAAEKGILLPTDFSATKKYHTGGLADYEQMAVLRKNERVLSPYQTRIYDDLNTRADLALRQTIAETQQTMQENQIQANSVLTKAIDKLVAVIEDKGGNSISSQNVTQNFTSRFSGTSLLESLTLEVD